MEFNERLKGLREDNDITQCNLALKLNMTQKKISRMETGESEPNIQDIKDLCKYFNVSADYILGLTDEKKEFPKNCKYNSR